MPPKRPRDTEGESPSEHPAKRRKKTSGYQGFGPEEKKQLKDYETWETQTRDILKRTCGKLKVGNDARAELHYLQNRVSALENKTSLDPICIGILGQTGAGKTSLLNAILGKELFLPVSGKKFCTSCVVKVSTSKANQYEATIHFLSDNEWKEEMKKLVEVLSKNGDDKGDDDNNHECVNDATNQLHALYGKGAEKKDFETLSEIKVEVPPGFKKTIKAQTAEEFSEVLEPYICFDRKGTNKLWPLIKCVEVTIPGSDLLPEGIVFFDIPGIGDPNRKRDEMWKQSILECSVLWIINSMLRADEEKVQATLLKESIRACVRGICTDMALVFTKSDVLNLYEYRREKGNKKPPVENKHDAILERNQDVKNKKEKEIREVLQKRLTADSEVCKKSKLVYTVSAEEFWEPNNLSQEETEIPELRKYIRKICLKEKQKLVTDYVKEVRSIHRLAKSISAPQSQDLVFHESGAEGLMNNIDSLEKDLETCFGEIEKPLSEGVDHARKNYKETIENLLRRNKGNQGFHKTLKEVCLGAGVYASKSFARINFNESLAELILSERDSIFDSIFRSSLWTHLDRFKTGVLSKIRKIGEDMHLQNNSKIENFIEETNVILKQLEKKILQKKSDIYKSLWVSIQTDLKPYYNEASQRMGSGCCVQMRRVLSDGIEHEILNKMFEKAKFKMESQFQELKTYIVLTLKEHISIVFNLVFSQQERPSAHLADIETECTEIDEIYDKLQMNS